MGNVRPGGLELKITCSKEAIDCPLGPRDLQSTTWYLNNTGLRTWDHFPVVVRIDGKELGAKKCKKGFAGWTPKSEDERTHALPGQGRRTRITVDRVLRARRKMTKNKANSPADCLVTEMLQWRPCTRSRTGSTSDSKGSACRRGVGNSTIGFPRETRCQVRERDYMDSVRSRF